MGFLPETLFGTDVDDIFAYTTTKKVWIRDRHVGLLYYSFMFLIVLWVVGYQILYNNEHFQRKDVVGMARMLYSHPTEGACDANLADCKANYIPLEELPYCREFKGGKPWPGDRHCQYADLVTAVPGGENDNKLFLPTSVEIVTQKLVNGKYVSEKASDCLQGGYMCHERGGLKDQFFYVADVHRFTIQFTSSYDRVGIIGTSLESPGSYWDCPSQKRSQATTRKWHHRLSDKDHCPGGGWVRREIPCMRGENCADFQKFDVFKHTGMDDVADIGPGLAKIRDFDLGFPDSADPDKPREQGNHQSRLFQHNRKGNGFLEKDLDIMQDDAQAGGNQTFPGVGDQEGMSVFRSKWGDVFKLGFLLDLAGVDLDNDYNLDGWTSRQAGAVIEVEVVYENLHAWLSSFGYKAVSYGYHVKELNMPYVSRVQLAAEQPDDYPLTRRYEVKRGVMIIFRIAGVFGIFNMTFLLIMLTTALALIATANALTDFVATYLVKWGSNFFHLKYEVSPDFSDMWVCETCGFHNLNWETNCRGIPAWECHQESRRCMALRPSSVSLHASARAPLERPARRSLRTV